MKNMAETQKISIVCWNLENFFHPDSGGPRGDMTPHEGWTFDRYLAKSERLGGAINKIFSDNGNAPSILGLVEVENLAVIKNLCTHLQIPFEMAHCDGIDDLYLDCVVLFDPTFFTLKSCVYHNTFDRYLRGEYVKVDLVLKSTGEVLTVFCCHLKARPNNQYVTEMYRAAACDNIQAKIWSMHDGDKVRSQISRIKDDETEKPSELVLDKNVVVMGDFNDDPFSNSLMTYLCASNDANFVVNQKNVEKVFLYNCAWEKLLGTKPGSHYYSNGRGSPWTMLDQIILSPALLKTENKVKYVRDSFTVVDGVSADEFGVPLRICKKDAEGNLVWQDFGYSDHFPVKITLEM